MNKSITQTAPKARFREVLLRYGQHRLLASSLVFLSLAGTALPAVAQPTQESKPAGISQSQSQPQSSSSGESSTKNKRSSRSKRQSDNREKAQAELEFVDTPSAFWNARLVNEPAFGSGNSVNSVMFESRTGRPGQHEDFGKSREVKELEVTGGRAMNITVNGKKLEAKAEGKASPTR